MPPPPRQAGHGAAPSNMDKLKMGAMMGGTVGAIMGFIYGTVTVFRGGAGPNGIMRTIGQYMLASGTTFGFFMGIGSVIRSDASPIAQQAYFQTRPRPLIMASHRAFRPQPSTRRND
ncbi:uncharacterized protein PpBr36_09274 [Pyricularia pennisetigena]|uniref:uncharacterized protein n=1 Tax=Pyricularia pennisetigena TaxID=1578925 RepID=UPI00114E906D|nr:uncharacterized protein PpBr36_09274 [Pyricularia pennisetigena]TLS21855.1 hypothetical protein PpBr36_09274 [Pyricularia pennisetigena]